MPKRGQTFDELKKTKRPTPYNLTDEIETDAKRQGGGEDDLKRNPGIGMSKGATAAGATDEEIEDEMIDGANTFEGDVESDVTPQGGVDPRRRPRRNK